MKSFLRELCPPIFLRWFRTIRGKNSLLFKGNYESWSSAQQVSTGYDTEEVLNSVCDSALKVKRGEAFFERDSVCFYQEEYRWPTLSCLLAVAAEYKGQLSVLDFGGSVGSFYLQHKKFFSNLEKIKWSVVEQEKFVDWGREEIQDDVLRFYYCVDDCLRDGLIDVIFLSSVLQYMEKPYEILSELIHVNAPYIIVDRTPFLQGAVDRLTVQTVPDSTYKAKFPAWFLGWQRFEKEMIENGYFLLTELPCEDKAELGEFKGAVFRRVK